MTDELLKAYENLDAATKRYNRAYQAAGEGRWSQEPGDVTDDLKRAGLDMGDAEDDFNKAVRGWIRETGHFPDLAEDMLNYLKDNGFYSHSLKGLYENYRVFPIERTVAPLANNQQEKECES